MSDFSILAVCTGNICRSPMAEQLLRVGTADWPSVTVASAGTHALVGEPMPPEAAELSNRYGSSSTAHEARQLIASEVRGADLVLGMAREHRRDAVRMVPVASRYAFTLREFARLVVGVDGVDFDDIACLPLTDPSARLSAAVELAASRRGLELPDQPDDDDVIDPYRRSRDVYELAAQQLVPAVQTTLAFLKRAVATDSVSRQVHE
ncbi:low molecular weight phosphatase family protein [Saxibacter everestensis]|uniref:Low molecular weight phosphatase family protein n=1 Tax=Saxibacter everestensis TaxID=2909229 RepID=A0ABY8QTB4_9MICO|nr:low molecular weight phosphatase family protein [Brevibacteriaceae bacterium ZFBP1038]